MARYNKFNKRTLIIAVTVILLCLVSITGATFALFTSSDDGKIGINATSGNLKVDIISDAEEPESLVGKVLKFETPKNKDTDEDDDEEEDEILFEPGAVYYTEGFRVKNTGNISINFIIYISEDETISADFSTAFEAWLTTDPTSREGMQKLEKFDGELIAGQTSETYYLVFRMKETAGNEFQDRIFTGVGITVCAVQGNGYPAGDYVDEIE